MSAILSCNKTQSEIDYQTNHEMQNIDSTYEDNPENTINYSENRTYGFALFNVHNDLNQRLNDINKNRRPYPVEYNVVSEITTFNGPATEEEKFSLLDNEQSKLNRNLQVEDRQFLIFNSYEEASQSRAYY